MGLADDIIIYGKRSVDPWSRISCCREPVLLVVEFCQVQGPRPLHCVPASPGPHLDLDSVAIWLMSSENVHGSTLVLYNQQMALYACVHHSTFLDIRARAFQRPFALALLMATKPTSKTLEKFMLITCQLISPLLICNRRLFKLHLSHLIDLSDSIQHHSFNEYYAIYADLALSPTCSSRIESIAIQARRLLPRFQAAYQYLSKSNRVSQCGVHSVDDVMQCLSTIGITHSTPLLALKNLAPCVYEKFTSSLASVREKFLNDSICDTFGDLFCADRPILKFSEFGNHLPEDKDNLLKILADDYDDKEQVLKSTVTSLGSILYTVLCGDRIAVCGTEQRQPTGYDLVKKLNLVRVALRREKVVWNPEAESIPRECQIFGQSASRSVSAKWNSSNVDAVLDLNGHWLRAKEYNGKVLSVFSRKRSSMFPSDRCIIKYIIAVLTEFCATVYIAKFRDPEKVADALCLSDADKRLMISFLTEIDFLKFIRLKDLVNRTLPSEIKAVKI